MNKIPLVVIAGPTASGKTRAGVLLAKELGGEVVSADSMQIYKSMTISTAKPTDDEMQGIKHHLIDFAQSDTSFSVADYLTMAREVIDDITSRGKLPIVVGGTGLYISSLVDNIKLDFTKDGIEEIARIAVLANETNENIGARRLHSIMESLLEDVSFNATGDHPVIVIKIDKKYVDEHLSNICKKFDLSKYIL